MFWKPVIFIAANGSGFFMKVPHTKPVRRFSACSRPIPRSMPRTSGSYQESCGMERIGETVAAPCFVAVVVFQRAKDAQALRGEKRKGAGRGGWNYRSVDWAEERWASPCGVAVLPVGCGDAPEVFGVAAIQAEAEGLVSACRDDGVGEVVGVGVAAVCEVEPRVRELMDEERVVAADVGVGAELDLWAGEVVPVVRRDWMCWRADGKEVKHHQLAVVIPSGVDETYIRTPGFGECVAHVQHPGPFDAIVELRGETGDLGIIEVGATGKGAAEEDRRVDGRYFAVN